MKITTSILFILVVSMGKMVSQEIVATTFEVMSGSTLYIQVNGSMKKVYDDQKWKFNSFEIRSSPDNMFVGAINHGGMLQDESGQNYAATKLLVFDKRGKLVLTVPNVINFAWSPNSKEIVYVKAKGNGESFRIIPRTLEVINVNSRKVRSFSPGAYEDIAWANYDSMIYYTNFANVFKVDPRTGEQTETPYKGIYFSPDGRYYFVANYEGGTFGVYERETNRDVTPKGYKGNPAVNFHRWLPKGSALVVGDMFREKHVIDIAKGKELKTISGEMLGYDDPTKEFIVLKHKRYFPEV